MIPVSGKQMTDLKIKKYPSYTYKLKEEKIEQYVDGIEAVKQAIYKILITQRYKYEIYDWNYGIELNDLLGKPKSYVYPELERRIKDALSADDRIKEVYDFQFPPPKQDPRTTIHVKFTVSTIYGDLLINTGLEVGD